MDAKEKFDKVYSLLRKYEIVQPMSDDELEAAFAESELESGDDYYDGFRVITELMFNSTHLSDCLIEESSNEEDEFDEEDEVDTYTHPRLISMHAICSEEETFYQDAINEFSRASLGSWKPTNLIIDSKEKSTETQICFEMGSTKFEASFKDKSASESDRFMDFIVQSVKASTNSQFVFEDGDELFNIAYLPNDLLKDMDTSDLW